MIHNKSVRNETHRAVSHLSTDAWTPISIDRWTNPKPISHSRLNPTDPCTYICANAHAWIGASACTCVFQNPAASTHCLTQSYTATPTPYISAPRCTEAESRMEQSRVRWQWHPSHAMNNQWTPSGAYNRGALLQSFTPRCLSLSFSLSLFLALSVTLSSSLSPVLSPSLSLHFSHTYYHYTATAGRSLIISSSSFSVYISLPCSAPPPPLPMQLGYLCDRLVMVSLILIQQYNSQAANKMTCCPLKDTGFYDL